MKARTSKAHLGRHGGMTMIVEGGVITMRKPRHRTVLVVRLEDLIGLGKPVASAKPSEPHPELPLS